MPLIIAIDKLSGGYRKIRLDYWDGRLLIRTSDPKEIKQIAQEFRDAADKLENTNLN